MSPIMFRNGVRAAAVALLFAASLHSTGAQTFAPSLVGKPVVLQGTLDVQVEDYADGHSRTRRFLQTSQQRIELAFTGKAPSLASGTRVRVRGEARADALAVDDGANDLEVVATILPDTMGEQSVVVLLVNFQDDASQPKTLDDARNLVFGDTSRHFQESSFGQVWLKGDAFGWFTLAMNKSECNPEGLASLADAKAMQAGVNLAAYQRKVYMFPANACPWQGLGGVGGTKTQAWVNGVMTLQVVGHELGHNLGLWHAHAYDCDTGIFGANCTSLDYGDAADLMGNNRTGHFSPFAKELLGWLNDGISPPITTATTSGLYAVEPYSAATVGPKALKVLAGKDMYGRNVWYYLEYRQPIGFDGVLANAGNLTQGVIVRTAVQGDGQSMYQLDMSPGSSTKFNEMADGALAVGQNFFDERAGVSITLASASATGANIDVQLVTPCIRARPTIAVAGPGAPVPAGTSVAYTMTVTNRDSSGCSTTTFDLWRSAPEGWTTTLGTTPMTLAPGASAGVPLDVASTTGAAPGNYDIRTSVTSPLGAVHEGTGGVTYSVLDPATLCTRVAPSISLVGGDAPVTAGATVGYTLQLTNRDSTACGSTNFSLARSVPTGWNGALSKTGLLLAPGATDSAVLNVNSPTTATGGQYGIGAAAASPLGAQHTASASAQYLVMPKLSIADAVVAEGNAGTTTANFVVSLSAPAVVPVTFNIATTNGTAVAGSDYTATSRTGITIPVGGKSATISVPVIGDLAIEANESFQVLVSNVAGAKVADGAAIGSVRNDDTQLWISDVAIVEGHSGTKAMAFTVKLSHASASPVTFNMATTNGTAAAGVDYVARTASATIPAGTTILTFYIAVAGDLVAEPHENFFVNLTNVKGATAVDAQAVGSIRNDDAVLTIADASVAEGNSGTKTLAFTVRLSAALASPVTFNLATANTTAAAGSDYVALALAGQSIPVGNTAKVFNVTIQGDTVREGNETFVLNVGSVVGAVAGDGQAVGTIVNDD